jgi:hypothetical protein
MALLHRGAFADGQDCGQARALSLGLVSPREDKIYHGRRVCNRVIKYRSSRHSL